MTFCETDTFWVVNWATDTSGHCNYIDSQWESVTGQAAADAIGKGWFETIHPDDREKIRIELNRAREERRAFHVVARLRRADGRYRWAMSVGGLRYDAQGVFVGFVGSLIDFHDQMAAQQELAETRQRLEAVMNAAPIGLSYSSDASCEYITGSKTILAQFEVDASDNLSASAPDPGAAGRRVRFFQNGRELADSEPPLQVATRERREVEPGEIEVHLPSGRQFVIEASGAPILGADGRLLGGVAATVDVTERKKSLDALRANEARYRKLFETSRDGIVAVDMSGRIIEANPAYQAMLGYTLEELRRLTYQQLTPENWHDMEAALVREQILPLGESAEYEKEYIRKDGALLPVSLRTWTVSDEMGRVVGMRAFVRDITERKQVEAALRESQIKFEAAFKGLAEAVFIADVDGNIIEFNDEFVRFFRFKDRDEATHNVADCAKYLAVRFPDGSATPFEQWPLPRALRGETASDVELRLCRTDTGETWWGSFNFSPITDPNGKTIGAVVAGRDITERKQSEAALRASERRMRRFYDAGLLGVIYWNVTGEVTDANDKFLEMVGYTRADLEQGRINWLEMTPPELLQLDAAAIAEVKARGFNSEPFEKQFFHKNGARVPVIVAGAMLDEARFNGVAFVLDISERKRAELALRHSELRYRSLIDATSSVTWRCPPSGLQVEPQPEWIAFTGQSAEEMLGDAWTKVVHPDDLATSASKWRDCVARGETFSHEQRIRRHDGEWRWMRVQAAPIRDASGEIVEWFGSNTDITERKQAELALQESRQQLALALEAGQLGFWDWDVQSGRVQFGGCWASMLGYDLRDIESHVRAWETLVHPDEKTAVTEILSAHLEGRTEFYECEHRMRHKDGSWRWILDRGQVVERDGYGRAVRAIGTHADVTARHEAEAALQEADRRKDEFLAMLAHELRNPLSAIRMSMQVFHKTVERTPPIERLMDMMDRQTLHLTRLVDDLLEVSRITRGKIELRKELVDLVAIVGQAIDSFGPLTKVHGHALEVSTPAEPIWLEADPVRITQALANLLNNAAKYMDPGGRVCVALCQQGNEAVLSIRDWGAGIPPDMLPQVFDLFTQLDRTIDRAQGGLGIGLALVKRLVEMHGGRVEAHSEGLGKGSEFVMRLPLRPAPAATGPSHPDANAEFSSVFDRG